MNFLLSFIIYIFVSQIKNNNNMKRQEYFEFLKENDFNEKQIGLIMDVRNQFEEFEADNENEEGYLFALDGWERDQWYTFNRSGLFEANDEENVSDITDWAQEDTRRYITEIVIENVLNDISFRTLDEMRNKYK